ncbi:unnamed protein product [Rhizophagus irregularis]|nr:unnamed protein product [Rhizophagus irregularis]
MKGKAVWTGDSRNNIIAALEKVPDSDLLRKLSTIGRKGKMEKLFSNIRTFGSKTSVSECSGEILREKFRCDAAGRERC